MYLELSTHKLPVSVSCFNYVTDCIPNIADWITDKLVGLD